MTESLLEELVGLETGLHHPGSPLTRERVERLLHPDFHEVGKSGQAYDRATIIDYLSTLQAWPDVVADQHRVQRLADDVALLTFRSTQRLADGQVVRALRSSIWLRTAIGWQLRYHQGTPVPAA